MMLKVDGLIFENSKKYMQYGMEVSKVCRGVEFATD
jgi:hypothetical protein